VGQRRGDLENVIVTGNQGGGISIAGAANMRNVSINLQSRRSIDAWFDGSVTAAYCNAFGNTGGDTVGLADSWAAGAT